VRLVLGLRGKGEGGNPGSKRGSSSWGEVKGGEIDSPVRGRNNGENDGRSEALKKKSMGS